MTPAGGAAGAGDDGGGADVAPVDRAPDAGKVAGFDTGHAAGAVPDPAAAAGADRFIDLGGGDLGGVPLPPPDAAPDPADEAAARRALRRRIDRAVAAIDTMLSVQVDAILAHPRFAALEAAWRGIAWLVQGLGADGLSRLRLFDARWAELVRDFERSVDVEHSALFDIVYNQEFDMPGGVPFSMILALYAVQHRPSRDHPGDDVGALRMLTQVAAAAFAPIVMDGAPGLFGLDGFAELDRRQSIAADFRQPDYLRLHSLQQLPDSRFLGLVVPRVRLRGSWRGRSAGDIGFRYDADDRQVLWGPGALAFGDICLRAFRDHRWLAAIRGTVRDRLEGGVVATLPPVDFATDAPGKILKPPVEVHVSETIDRELAEAGFIAIRRVKDTPFLAIHNMPSLHRPARVFGSEVARVNERLGTMLNYILCVARFAHYIKVIGREWIGSFQSATECEVRLQRWLNDYTSGGDDMDYDAKARFPLREGRITVADIAGKPGAYECRVALKPHFQLDQVVSEFHLVTTIQEPRAA
ncbi:type VI secretion system contractile sheath large subunit [Sphingomonas sp. CFBP 8760]|uniref:type VI secretion system contractile sheath large subunit n=1 Tax=Sphingomonas sp. CFBP 8760 TaxID=2775282 RepID=UPI00177AE23F|nr:type VI secretion system contractile sheath large subunit [Sphingomonas sp. CFBP 8760]MBD8547684.1 type VI secretion system contractile sheath large subunit [Sphingomonas sp. CFBP 8760]